MLHNLTAFLRENTWVVLSVSAIAGLLLFTFQTISHVINTRRIIREKHIDLLNNIAKQLIDHPELWGIYDTSPCANDKQITPQNRARREAFIFQHFNTFLLIHDYYTKWYYLKNRSDKQIWRAYQSYICQFFRESADAVTLFGEPRTKEIYHAEFLSFCGEMINRRHLGDSAACGLSHQGNSDIVLTTLSGDNVYQAIRLLKSVFPYCQGNEAPEMSLLASLDPDGYSDTLRQYSISTLRYCVAVAQQPAKVVGITGLYYYNHGDVHIPWIGWTAVDPAYRGQGLGRKLIDKMICDALAGEREYIRLYTSNHPNEVAANNLYKKLGFEEFQPAELIENTPYLKYFLQLKIDREQWRDKCFKQS